MNDQQFERMLSKVYGLADVYEPYVYERIQELEVSVLEIKEQLFGPPSKGHRPIHREEEWGAEQQYGWFKTSVKIPENMQEEEVYLLNKTNASEVLLYIDGCPRGMFDNYDDCSVANQRLHCQYRLASCAQAGDCYAIDMEGYAGHRLYGNMPYETPDNVVGSYPRVFPRIFRGLFLAVRNKQAYAFVRDIRLARQWYEALQDNSDLKWKIARGFQEIYRLVQQKPNECSYTEWMNGLEQANKVLDVLFAHTRSDNGLGYGGLVGHSHLDTAWLWPLDETVKKAARTFSNALEMMDRYPDYTFIQSSVIYLEWMKEHYPFIFERIRERAAEGRWEPNGGSFVECDGNLTSGEMMIRQFLRGQSFLRREFGYTADTFWLPDTFGYSAAIPQILKGCGIRYFATTKLSWNDTNRFPYDSFIWRGIDGTQVIVHFNVIHCWPDIQTVCTQIGDNTLRKRAANCKLISFGYGDGGGGPTAAMIETAEKIHNLEGIPHTEFTTVSRFMEGLEERADDLPMYNGELYMEGHRGTLTQMHEIKRTNRKAEIALRNLELANVLKDMQAGVGKHPDLEDMYRILLTNQFHDILPGTCIAQVHDRAIGENQALIDHAEGLLQEMLRSEGGTALFNPLSFDHNQQVTIPILPRISMPKDVQAFTGLDGKQYMAFYPGCIPGFGCRNLASETEENSKEVHSAFFYDGETLETPFAKVRFDDGGAISSFVDKASGRELCRTPWNTFFWGDDVPAAWDNWDIDADQGLKRTRQNHLTFREVAADGRWQFRLRSHYAIGRHSLLEQDMVFYADTPRVDFETVIDWKDPHSLLKVAFDCNLVANKVKTEIAFGYLERDLYYNTTYEQARFEVANHQYSDISETRYGVALLNDCKYGISFEGTCMMLTLHKGGCHPDPRGDVGKHRVTYAVYPHSGPFGANVVREARRLNNPVIPVCGGLYTQPPFSLKGLVDDGGNVMAECLKFAEDGNGYVIRLYECESSAAICRVQWNIPLKRVQEVNMLEDLLSEIPVEDNGFVLSLRPFEIKTIRVKLR